MGRPTRKDRGQIGSVWVGSNQSSYFHRGYKHNKGLISSASASDCPKGSIVVSAGGDGGGKPPEHSEDYRHFSRPQSSSASRFTAGAAGFLLLIQCRERPER